MMQCYICIFFESLLQVSQVLHINACFESNSQTPMHKSTHCAFNAGLPLKKLGLLQDESSGFCLNL